MIRQLYPYAMKPSNFFSKALTGSLLIINGVFAVLLIKEKSYNGQLNEAISRQRIEFEQELIKENQHFQMLLKQQREAMEGQSEREAAWIAKDVKADETIKNITNLLTVNVTFKDKLIGGVENVNIAVTNSSAFKMEQVTVKLSYLKKGVTYGTQMVTLYEIQPHSTRSATAPDGAVGNNVTGTIYKVRSAALGHP